MRGERGEVIVRWVVVLRRLFRGTCLRIKSPGSICPGGDYMRGNYSNVNVLGGLFRGNFPSDNCPGEKFGGRFSGLAFTEEGIIIETAESNL